MLYKYTIIDQSGKERQGTVEAPTEDAAISALQRQGYVIVSIASTEKKGIFSSLEKYIERVSVKEVVFLTRQLSTLFEAQVSAVTIFTVLGTGSADNKMLQRVLLDVAEELKGGSTLSRALSRQSGIFSPFYVSMVRIGEETGRLSNTFTFLADYLDRTYETMSRARNALIYPSVVIVTLLGIGALMLTVVIPGLRTIIDDLNAEVPFYTKIILNISDFFTQYGVFLFGLIALGIFAFWRYQATERGRYNISRATIDLPIVGGLYRKLYVSRIADTIATGLKSSLAMDRTIELAATVVGNKVYEGILNEVVLAVRGGKSLSESFRRYPEMPTIFVMMVKVGEEAGSLGETLGRLSAFFQHEFDQTVQNAIGLIEPILIIVLGASIGVFVAAVLLPIYNVASAI